MLSTDDLIGYQRAEFAVASALRSWQLLLQFLLAVPAALSIFVEGDRQATYYLAILGLLLLLGWIIVDNRARAHRDAAESARRATLIVEGLGEALTPTTLFDLRGEFRVSDRTAAKHTKAGYFATIKDPGPSRLSEILEESAFWTADLLQGSAVFMSLTFVGLVLLGLFAFGLAFPELHADGLLIVARLFLVFLVFLVFLLSTDVYGSAVGYWSASYKVDAIRRRLVDLEGRGYPIGDVLLSLTDYNSVVEAAPQSVPFVYNIRHDHLERRWREYQVARSSSRNIA